MKHSLTPVEEKSREKRTQGRRSPAKIQWSNRPDGIPVKRTRRRRGLKCLHKINSKQHVVSPRLTCETGDLHWRRTFVKWTGLTQKSRILQSPGNRNRDSETTRSKLLYWRYTTKYTNILKVMYSTRFNGSPTDWDASRQTQSVGRVRRRGRRSEFN